MKYLDLKKNCFLFGLDLKDVIIFILVEKNP